MFHIDRVVWLYGFKLDSLGQQWTQMKRVVSKPAICGTRQNNVKSKPIGL
jgi:hypothetical protein